MRLGRPRAPIVCLAVAIVCLAFSLVMSVSMERFARYVDDVDRLAFLVMSGYVVFMFAFLMLWDREHRGAASGPSAGRDAIGAMIGAGGDSEAERGTAAADVGKARKDAAEAGMGEVLGDGETTGGDGEATGSGSEAGDGEAVR